MTLAKPGLKACFAVTYEIRAARGHRHFRFSKQKTLRQLIRLNVRGRHSLYIELRSSISKRRNELHDARCFSEIETGVPCNLIAVI